MSNRAAKFVSAVFASILAGTLAPVPLGAAPAADDCLSAPNGPTTDGSHWYYRIDRATKRHCWYLREQGEKVSQSHARSFRSPRTTERQAETSQQHSIADAHAELPAQSRFEPPIRNDVPVAAMQAEPAVNEPLEPAPRDMLVRQPSVVGSRWPDPSAVSSRVAPVVTQNTETAAATDNLAPRLASNSAAASMPAVAETPPPAVELAPRDQSRSLPMLLGAIAAASALAAIIASIVLKFGAAGRSRQPRVRRAINWERSDDARFAISDRSDANLPPRRSGIDRDPDRAAERNRRLAEAFSQLTGRAPS
jgi:hypothetical protein